ncbi:MAG: hypothetical protein ACYS67_01415 [Planctomycetota bacterium]
MSKDEEHLRLLSIFHYIVGGIGGFFASFFIIHLILGIGILAGAFESDGPEPFAGVVFLMSGLTIVTLGWTFAICLIIAGRRLGQRRSYKFCFVIACISCAFQPFGTVLGVFTIIVLMRPTVKELFGISP